jgi:hypothetical protein
VPATEVDAVMRALFERFQVWRLYADSPYWHRGSRLGAGRFGACSDCVTPASSVTVDAEHGVQWTASVRHELRRLTIHTTRWTV